MNDRRFTPEKQSDMPPISEATFSAGDHLMYPYSHDGKPVIISPTDYGLNYKASRKEKVGSH